MHELFVLSETVPVEPGTSPFRVRGVIYDRILEHARRLPGGLDAFLADVRDPRVAFFLRQTFRFRDPYDALPLVPAQVALSRLQGADFEVATRGRAAQGAVDLIPRMFRLILGFSRPRAWALHAPRLMSEYCGFGNVSLEGAGDGGALFDVGPVPQFLAASHVNTLIGIFEGSLGVLRARNVASRYFDVARAGDSEGYPLLRYRLELGWS